MKELPHFIMSVLLGCLICYAGYMLAYAVHETGPRTTFISPTNTPQPFPLTTVNKVRVDDRELVVGLADILVDTDQAKKGVTAEMSRFRQEAQSVFNSMKAEIMRLRKENEELKAPAST